MADVHRVTMTPRWVGGVAGYRYDVHYGGDCVVEGSKSPFTDAARWLSESGRTGVVELSRSNSPDSVCMRGDIARFSSLVAREGSSSSPRFVKWTPFSGVED